MKMRLITIMLIAAAASAQSRKLTLSEAHAIALRSNPAIASATYRARAADQVVTETRAAKFPTITGNITGVDTLDGSRVSAGGLNNPIIYSRVAGGISASQLITDFGRTSNLTASSRLQAQSEQQTSQSTRANVLLAVDRAFFNLLRARAVLTVANETLKTRQTVLDQVTTLMNSKLKSALDVSFSRVSVSEAKLLVINAQNDLQSASAELSSTLGSRDLQEFEPVEEAEASALQDTAREYLAAAMRDRPDLSALRLRRNAALRFAEAEKDLSRPTIGAIATAGRAALTDDRLTDRFAAAGFNISIPVFNGKLYSARHDEAVLRAQALDESVRDFEDQISRDVRVAWLGARTAAERMTATADLLAQSAESLDLAQARYELGLSSIIELNQAELNKTSAEIAVAAARYEYQMQRSVLDFQTGVVK